MRFSLRGPRGSRKATEILGAGRRAIIFHMLDDVQADHRVLFARAADSVLTSDNPCTAGMACAFCRGAVCRPQRRDGSETCAMALCPALVFVRCRVAVVPAAALNLDGHVGKLAVVLTYLPRRR